MDYYNLNTKEWADKDRVAFEFPQHTFPEDEMQWPPEYILPWVRVQLTAKPEYDSLTQDLRKTEPEQLDLGGYEAHWEVVALEPYIVQQKLSEALLPHKVALAQLFQDKAREKDYDSVITVCMRAGFTNPWQNECQAFAYWMSQQEKEFYEWRDNVLAGRTTLVSAEVYILRVSNFVW